MMTYLVCEGTFVIINFVEQTKKVIDGCIFCFDAYSKQQIVLVIEFRMFKKVLFDECLQLNNRINKFKDHFIVCEGFTGYLESCKIF